MNHIKTLVIGLAGLSLLVDVSYAGCRNPAPRAIAFSSPGGNCPSGYYSSGGSCVPSSSNSNYAFYINSGSCPTQYYKSGNSCVASSQSSCYAYPSNGSCPSGFYSSGNACVSN